MTAAPVFFSLGGDVLENPLHVAHFVLVKEVRSTDVFVSLRLVGSGHCLMLPRYFLRRNGSAGCDAGHLQQAVGVADSGDVSWPLNNKSEPSNACGPNATATAKLEKRSASRARCAATSSTGESRKSTGRSATNGCAGWRN